MPPRATDCRKAAWQWRARVRQMLDAFALDGLPRLQIPQKIDQRGSAVAWKRIIASPDMGSDGARAQPTS
eukprot:4538416-Pyramimonas_sp.AAC.1